MVANNQVTHNFFKNFHKTCLGSFFNANAALKNTIIKHCPLWKLLLLNMWVVEANLLYLIYVIKNLLFVKFMITLNLLSLKCRRVSSKFCLIKEKFAKPYQWRYKVLWLWHHKSHPLRLFEYGCVGKLEFNFHFNLTLTLVSWILSWKNQYEPNHFV